MLMPTVGGLMMPIGGIGPSNGGLINEGGGGGDGDGFWYGGFWYGGGGLGFLS